MTTSTIVAVVSALLVLAGVIMVLRDSRRRSASQPPRSMTSRPPIAPRAMAKAPSEAAGSQPPTATMPPPPMPDITGGSVAQPDADVTIVHRTRQAVATITRRRAESAAPAAASSGSAFDALVAAIAAIRAETNGDTNDTEPESQRWPSITGRWRALEGMIETGVARLNTALNPHGLIISAVGEPSWSFRNRGYGAYRRILLGGKSIAWLRTELTQSGQLITKVRAHQVEHALVNTQAALPADGVTPNAVIESLAIVLRPAAEFAAWSMPRQEAQEAAGTAAWSSVDELTREAVSLAIEAFKVSAVTLLATTSPAWDDVTGRQRWRLALRHGDQDIGMLDMALATTTLEVTVTAVDRLRNSLDRRRRLDLAGLSAKDLADVLTANAWPLIADAQNRADAPKLGYAG